MLVCQDLCLKVVIVPTVWIRKVQFNTNISILHNYVLYIYFLVLPEKRTDWSDWLSCLAGYVDIYAMYAEAMKSWTFLRLFVSRSRIYSNDVHAGYVRRIKEKDNRITTVEWLVPSGWWRNYRLNQPIVDAVHRWWTTFALKNKGNLTDAAANTALLQLWIRATMPHSLKN